MTLYEYLSEATKCIYRCGVKNPSEDMIAFVANHMIRGDLKFKQFEDGNGNRGKWRYFCGKCGVRNWFRRNQKKHCELELTLSTMSNHVGKFRGNYAYVDVVKSSDKGPEFNCDFNSLMKDMEQILTPLQFRCVVEHYMNGKKQSTVSRELGISRQRVQQHVKRATLRIRKLLSKYGREYEIPTKSV